MPSVIRITAQGKVKAAKRQEVESHPELTDLDTMIPLIQALIPLGLHAFAEVMQAEVAALAGMRYSRTGGEPGCVRWGRQRGSIFLADQKVPVAVQRVRDRQRRQEIPLQSYQQLQAARAADAGLFRKVLAGLSCRDYEASAEAVPEAFGLSASSVSRRFIRASAKQLQALQERRLEGYDLVALLLDGKTFAADSMVIALGITLTGAKVILGFVQTATENETVCSAFLRELVDRGLRTVQGLLVVLDGAKGLRKAVTTVFGAQAAVQRCQWHKRENVVAYLPKALQATWRRKLQAAYERPTYAEAKAALLRLRPELRLLNESAVKSLDEGLEETLTLHRLGVFRELGISLKTTNCLESLNSLVEQRVAKVDRWRTSDQKQRWLAAALLDSEPRLRRIKGFRALPLLRQALLAQTQGEKAERAIQVA
ncbi:MAG: IS256 family transposase [Acidobacteria bacterium]|nr:MAG: IS256 family transposase [Acidobacteriota bacterium]